MDQLTVHKKKYIRNQGDLYLAFEMGNKKAFLFISARPSLIASHFPTRIGKIGCFFQKLHLNTTCFEEE